VKALNELIKQTGGWTE